MNETNDKIKKTCTWWVCTLVALIPIFFVLWVIYNIMSKG